MFPICDCAVLPSLDDSLPEPNDAPIGVFDSGVGGLTVLKALEAALPHERFIYLGDTARLPYGTKSAGTVQRYAVQAAHALVERGVKALVIACNTASAVALDALRDAYRPLPVFGVVDPGAEAACRASRNGRIAVIATESTVRGGAYQRAILSRRPDARALARPCPLLVSLAEEGWIDGDVPERVVDAYLGAWAARGLTSGLSAARLHTLSDPRAADAARRRPRTHARRFGRDHRHCRVVGTRRVRIRKQPARMPCRVRIDERCSQATDASDLRVWVGIFSVRR